MSLKIVILNFGMYFKKQKQLQNRLSPAVRFFMIFRRYPGRGCLFKCPEPMTSHPFSVLLILLFVS